MNPDFRIKVGMTNHRKTRLLQRVVAAGGDIRLGDHGVMCLVRLWEYATEHRIDGVLSGMSVAEIEAEAEWGGAPGALVKFLKDCKWLDKAGKWWKLHEWEEHQPFVAGEPERKRNNSYNAHLRHHKKRSNPKCEWCMGAQPPHAGRMQEDTTRMRVVSPNTNADTGTTTETDTGTSGEREAATTRGRAIEARGREVSRWLDANPGALQCLHCSPHAPHAPSRCQEKDRNDVRCDCIEEGDTRLSAVAAAEFKNKFQFTWEVWCGMRDSARESAA